MYAGRYHNYSGVKGNVAIDAKLNGYRGAIWPAARWVDDIKECYWRCANQ